MTIVTEQSLRDFRFWSGARSTVQYLTWDDLDTIEDILESDGNTYSDTDINDLFWFEDDLIAEWLGYRDFEELMEDRKEWAES